ncbi:MAG TPA: hypothetical protein VKF14_03555 [Candidatus Dormibacteraeota bacterium]|nr:hypothetical protein [Candidatus Dormibacteraeota bacterium]
MSTVLDLRAHPGMARLGRPTLRLTTPRLVLGGAVVGVLVSVVWSSSLVDRTIGEDLASDILGYSAAATPITNTLMGAIFALVSGLTGTFTACNLAGFSAVAPLASQRRSIGSSLRPPGWLAVGAGTGAGIHDAVGALIGTYIPQLSSDMVGRFPVRLIQSVVVFGVIGSVMLAIGLTSAGVLRNPLAQLFRRHPRAEVVTAGGLIGAFLVGRPFPLFFKMFQYAASTHDPAFGAAAFVLQILGNVTLMAGLYLALTHVAGGRVQLWLAASPDRLARFSAAALIVFGAFLVTYWCVRVPSFFGIGWWPTVPWS